tara:strand:- start:15942 stop:16268 length:327 start_codon:yes stop_codon:yes gene_type:complete
MQNTRFSYINDKVAKVTFGFLVSSWRSKSINLLSILFGYFLFANFITKFISEGKNELLMIPIIIFVIEIIIRSKPSNKSNLFNLWLIADKIRIGAIYALILEAFKLGS